MERLENIKIGFALTGSFCTLETAFKIMIELIREGADVTPIFSDTVSNFDTRFYSAKEVRDIAIELTKKQPIDSIVSAEPIGPSKMFDVLLVIPCTGNTLVKINYAITDTPVTMAVKSHVRNNRPVVIGVSTNDGLGNSAKNIGSLLHSKNLYFVPFGQDNPVQKEKSLVFKEEEVINTIEKALEEKQISPILV